MASTDPLSPRRAHDLLDALLPPHAQHAPGSNEWVWTTRDGHYRVNVHSNTDVPPGGAITLNAVDTPWHVTVPRTGAGLDALTVCMVLAGAIVAPRPGSTTVVERGGASTVVSVNHNGNLTNYPGAEAFALGVALVEQSGRTGRY
jgi:hypothetical protein